MPEPVNARRAYDSSRRQEQARANRWAVLEAARGLFVAEGYPSTTMAAVARAAEVSVETVYKSFGNKAGLAKAVFDVAVVGDDEPVPIMERSFVRDSQAEPDARTKLHHWAAHVAELAPRVGPIQLVLRAAALTDPGAADVWAQVRHERLAGMTMFAKHLADGGHLRAGVSVAEAADVLWLHGSVEVWDQLMNDRGWSSKRFTRWVGDQTIAALL